MADRRKVFRIEQMKNTAADQPVSGGEPEAALHHGEIMNELRALRALLAPHADMGQDSESYRAELAEMKKLKNELDLIYDAINRTKHEIATLHVTGFKGQ